MTDIGLSNKAIVVNPDQWMRDQIVVLARQEDRKLGQMARTLIREALEHRGITSPASEAVQSAVPAK